MARLRGKYVLLRGEPHIFWREVDFCDVGEIRQLRKAWIKIRVLQQPVLMTQYIFSCKHTRSRAEYQFSFFIDFIEGRHAEPPSCEMKAEPRVTVALRNYFDPLGQIVLSEPGVCNAGRSARAAGKVLPCSAEWSRSVVSEAFVLE